MLDSHKGALGSVFLFRRSDDFFRNLSGSWAGGRSNDGLIGHAHEEFFHVVLADLHIIRGLARHFCAFLESEHRCYVGAAVIDSQLNIVITDGLALQAGNVLCGTVAALQCIPCSDGSSVQTHEDGDMTFHIKKRHRHFLAAAGLSLALTPADVRSANQFTWEPVLEVGKLFFGIFVTIVPVLEMLKAGMAGAFAPVVAMVTNADGTANNAMYFWMTGALSGFLDNAPTYLAFFNMAGGDASVLMTEGALTLMAISMGSVFMGANSYIGNAPNFMVVAIVQNRGLKMPSFFGYLLWSVGILIPIFLLLTWLYLV